MNKFKPNGVARIAHKIRWPGIAVRFGKDPDEEKVMELKVRITTKLVSTHFGRYDRVTGRDCSSYNPHVKPSRLVSYRLDGQEEWTTTESK